MIASVESRRGRNRCPVQRISIPWMLSVVASLDRLDTLTPDMTLTDAFFDLIAIESQLETLFGQSVYGPYLRTSREKGNALYAAVQEVTRMDAGDKRWEAPMNWRVGSLRTKRNEFKLVFLSEISTLPVFLAQPKDNYDVMLLIDHGAGLFPGNMLVKVPEAAFDAGEVGKALAFQLPTACGFHTYRVLESVLKRYWDAVSGEKKRPSPETIGKIAADMVSQGIGDDKVLEALKQIAKLHRNPCIHEVVLSEEEAIGTLGIVRSVIAMMLSSLPDAPPPTTVAA